jgi:glycogenin glucosyltransferase
VEEAYVPPVQTNLEAEKRPEPQPEPQPEYRPEPEIIYAPWDASRSVVHQTCCSLSLTIIRAPPPADSMPEASNFPATHYDMSSDPTPFKAPERYPDPPKDMYYEVPKTPTYQKPAPIFPWEINAARATRVFPEDNDVGVPEPPSLIDPGPAPADQEIPEDKSAPVTPTTPTIQLTPADPWQTYTRGNAWDDIPEIERYIGSLQKNRKGNIQVLQGYGSGITEVSSPGARRHSMKLTDFPTELERPSLPVTPAPIRRPSFWGEERDEDGELPAAEGVPSQEDWVLLSILMREVFFLLCAGSSGPTGATRPAPVGRVGK